MRTPLLICYARQNECCGKRLGLPAWGESDDLKIFG